MRSSAFASVGYLLALAAPATAEAPRNLALGRPYEMSPAPNYGLCTDPGDAKQLTDGQAHGADWTRPSTVGWVHLHQPMVTLDLGETQAIDRVCFYSVGGGLADVFFPVAAAVGVSEEGKDYQFAGVISGAGALVQDRKKSYAHTFASGDLRAKGRFVRLVFQPQERFLFLDEIEVWGGESPPEAATTREPLTEEKLAEVFATAIRSQWIAVEWLEIREQIERMAGAGGEIPAPVADQVEKLHERVLSMDVMDETATTQLRSDYLALRAEVARPHVTGDLLCERIDPWADLRGGLFPSAKARATSTTDAPIPGIELTMWQNEYEPVAWMVTNLREQPRRLRVRLAPLTPEDGAAAAWRGRLSLREVIPVPGARGYRVQDALPLLAEPGREEAEWIVPPHESRILWLTLRSLDLSPGRYRTKLEIQPVEPGGTGHAIPLTLQVAPLQMPPAGERTLHSYAWEQLKGWNVPEGAVADLRAHGVDVFLLHPVSIPVPRFSADRTVVESVDFTALDEVLDRIGHPRIHGVFWGETDGMKSWFDLDKPTGRACFKQWIAAWAKHLKERGYEPDDFLFYPYDEKIPERFVRVARLIKEVDPDLQIYCNRVRGDPDMMLRIAPYIDIWCPNYRAFTQHLTEEQRQAFQTIRDKYQPEIWTYACDGPAKVLSPSTYYRSLPWLAFRNGATGAGFWVYGHTSNSWDDYDGRDPDYGVVYYARDAPAGIPRGESVIPSRRWEAWREGTEDYQYLHELQEALGSARKAGVEESLIREAEEVLEQCVGEVLDESPPPDCYDKARRSLTEAILRLRRATADR